MTAVKPKILTSVSAVVFLLAIFGTYGLYKAKAYLEGPEIAITSPSNGEVIGEQLLLISGKAANVSTLFVNGRQIFADKEGNFSDSLLLAPGYNIMEIKGNDKFGRETKQNLEIVYKNK